MSIAVHLHKIYCQEDATIYRDAQKNCIKSKLIILLDDEQILPVSNQSSTINTQGYTKL